MPNKERTIALSVLLLLFLSFSLLDLGVANGQLEEVAGPLNFVVNMSGSETLHLVIANGGATPIYFNATPPVLKAIPNTTTPTVTISPLTGVLQPHEQLPLNVTVYMPSAKNKPGLSWSGIISVVQVTNQTNPGGAVIQTGVAKIISIASASPVPLPLWEYAIAVVIIIAVAAAVAIFALKRRKRAPAGRGAGRRTAALAAARSRIRRRKPRRSARHTRRARASKRRKSKARRRRR